MIGRALPDVRPARSTSRGSSAACWTLSAREFDRIAGPDPNTLRLGLLFDG